jgi:hypothetical protein
MIMPIPSWCAQMSELLIFRDTNRKGELEPPCRQVLQHYRLPAQSLRCIFDDTERPELLRARGFGPDLCGFFSPIELCGLRSIPWPADIIKECLAGPTIEKPLACDVVIYVRKRTCETRIGAVITFAHELQHFVQYGGDLKVWRANKFIERIAGSSHMDLQSWNLPMEHEAQLVSKRVAEIVLGKDEVRTYVEKQIADENDAQKWIFFQGLNSSGSLDLLKETIPWVHRYKRSLEELYPAETEEDPNFARDHWWK